MIHIPNEQFMIQAARDAAADLGCILSYGASERYLNHTRVTVTGERCQEWHGEYTELMAKQKAETR